MIPIEIVENRRVYRRHRFRVVIDLIDRRRWRWRVLDGEHVAGEGSRWSLDRARRDADAVIDMGIQCEEVRS